MSRKNERILYLKDDLYFKFCVCAQVLKSDDGSFCPIRILCCHGSINVDILEHEHICS